MNLVTEQVFLVCGFVFKIQVLGVRYLCPCIWLKKYYKLIYKINFTKRFLTLRVKNNKLPFLHIFLLIKQFLLIIRFVYQNIKDLNIKN